MEDRERLEQIWCSVLGLDHATDDQNLFACGGNSLDAIQLMHVVSVEFGRAVPADVLFVGRTFRALLESVTAGPSTASG